LLLILVAIALPLPLKMYSYQSGNLYISHIIYFFLAALVSLYVLKGDVKFEKFNIDRIYFIYLIIIIIGFISVINSYIQLGSASKLNRGITYQAVEIVLISTGLITLLITKSFITKIKHSQQILIVMIFVGIIGCSQILAFWTSSGFPLFYKESWKNILVNSAIQGKIINVYYWNIFLAFMIPILFILFIRSTNKRIRALLFVVLLVFGIGILAATFVDTWLLIFVALLVAIPWYPSLIKKISYILLLIVPIPLIVVGGAILSERQLSFARRFELIDLGLNIWKQQPILGVGPGNFNLYMIEFAPPSYFVGFNEIGLNTFHNYYIQVLVELGILGLVATLILMFLIGRRLYKIINLLPNGFYKDLVIGILCSFVGLLFSLISGENFYLLMGIGGLDFFLGNIYIWILLGMGLLGESFVQRVE
jgi:O-antigen ligase